jgi:hypothetical protein
MSRRRNERKTSDHSQDRPNAKIHVNSFDRRTMDERRDLGARTIFLIVLNRRA